MGASESGRQQGVAGQGGMGKVLGLVSHGAPATPLLALSSEACFGAALGPLFLEPCVPICMDPTPPTLFLSAVP